MPEYEIPEFITVNGHDIYPNLYNIEGLEKYLSILEKIKPFEVKGGK